MAEEKQIVSRERVVEHGEVYTAEREVKSMCDLAGEELARVGSRVLEPACGTGNFLEEILRRKMRAATEQAGPDGELFDFLSAKALSSLYGIDILKDNVLACRKRLLFVWKEEAAVAGRLFSHEMERLGTFLLERNVVSGDSLTMTRPGRGRKPEALVLSEWTFNRDGMAVARTDYDMQKCLAYEKSRQGGGGGDLMSCCKVSVPEPKPLCHHPSVPFRSLHHAERP